jgi:hypothetical protein
MVGKPEGKRETTRKFKRRYERSIGIKLREMAWEGANWMHLVQDREQWRALASTVMNIRVP